VNIELLREGSVRRRAVTTYPKNYCVARIQLWPISLIGFEFVASGFCKGEHVEDKDNVLLPFEVAELDLLPVIAEQGKIWSLVSGTQDVRCGSLSAGGRSEGKGDKQPPDERAKTFHGDLS
jgi:hypothetical protein